MKRQFVISEVTSSTWPPQEGLSLSVRHEHGFQVGDFIEVDMGPWYPPTRVQRIKRAINRIFWRWV